MSIFRISGSVVFNALILFIIGERCTLYTPTPVYASNIARTSNIASSYVFVKIFLQIPVIFFNCFVMSNFNFLGSPQTQEKVKPFLGWDLIILETLEVLQFRLSHKQPLGQVCPFALTPEPTPLQQHD